MEQMKEGSVSVLGLSLVTMLFWGMAPLFEKSALANVSPLVALAIRSMIMVGAYGAILLGTGAGPALLRVDGKSLLLIAISALLGGIAGLLTYFHALKIGDAALVVPVTASYPLVTVFLATVVLGEPISLSRLAGAALIVAGVYLIR
jgi:transporter family protein